MPPTTPERETLQAPTEGTSPRRVLVVATERCVGPRLLDELRNHLREPTRVRVVAPALMSRLDYWASDEAAGRAAARERLDASLREFATLHVEIEGAIGDADPLLAIDDEVRTFDPDEIVVATHPPERATWLERDLVPQARARYEAPITHLVVEPETRSGAVVPPEKEPRAHRTEGHRVRDVSILVAALVLSVVGTLVSLLLYDIDAPTWLLATWVLVMDLGIKVALIGVLWALFLRRARADRLDY